jgi:hypothetical protein
LALPGQTRTDFVYHVYVDPIHGDDWASYNMNPHFNGTTWNIQYSQPFTSIVNPPGTMINDVTRTSQTPPPWIPINWVNSHLWLDPPFTTHLFVNDTRFGHYLNPGASNGFDAWGVGDSGNGGTTVDEVPYNPLAQWFGLRINCESSNGGGVVPANRTNLQTFLIVQGVTVKETQSQKGLPPRARLSRLSTQKAGLARTRITDYMKSKALRTALAARKARIDAISKARKK